MIQMLIYQENERSVRCGPGIFFFLIFKDRSYLLIERDVYQVTFFFGGREP